MPPLIYDRTNGIYYKPADEFVVRLVRDIGYAGSLVLVSEDEHGSESEKTEDVPLDIATAANMCGYNITIVTLVDTENGNDPLTYTEVCQ